MKGKNQDSNDKVTNSKEITPLLVMLTGVLLAASFTLRNIYNTQSDDLLKQKHELLINLSSKKMEELVVDKQKRLVYLYGTYIIPAQEDSIIKLNADISQLTNKLMEENRKGDVNKAELNRLQEKQKQLKEALGNALIKLQYEVQFYNAKNINLADADRKIKDSINKINGKKNGLKNRQHDC